MITCGHRESRAPVISIDHHASTKFPSGWWSIPARPGRDGYSFEPGRPAVLGAVMPSSEFGERDRHAPKNSRAHSRWSPWR